MLQRIGCGDVLPDGLDRDEAAHDDQQPHQGAALPHVAHDDERDDRHEEVEQVAAGSQAPGRVVRCHDRGGQQQQVRGHRDHEGPSALEPGACAAPRCDERCETEQDVRGRESDQRAEVPGEQTAGDIGPVRRLTGRRTSRHTAEDGRQRIVHGLAHGVFRPAGPPDAARGS